VFTPRQCAAPCRLRDVAGVGRADPLLLVQQNIRKGSDIKQFVVVGHRIGGLGEPPPEEGRGARAPGGGGGGRGWGARALFGLRWSPTGGSGLASARRSPSADADSPQWGW